MARRRPPVLRPDKAEGAIPLPNREVTIDKVLKLREVRIIDPDLTPMPAEARRKVIGPWFEDNAGASQTDVDLTLEGGTHTEITAIRPGSVTGISAHSNEARTAGTLTLDVTIDGSNTGLQAVLDGTNTTVDTTTQAELLDHFAAGAQIGVHITTDGSWSPVTADISAMVEITDDPAPT